MTTRAATFASAAFAEEIAQNYERDFVPGIGEPTAQLLLAAAQPAPGARVLDVACGTGIAARLALESVGAQGTVAGLDPNPGMLSVARGVTGDRITWYEAPAEHMPLADASVDLVLCSMGLQFFADRAQALREMHRVLAPGGRVAWCTPGPTPPLFRAIDQALTAHVGSPPSMFLQTVFALHDPDEAQARTEGAGFSDVQVQSTAVRLHLPPPADFFWAYVHSTPLAAMVAEMDEGQQRRLEADVLAGCAPHIDSDDPVMEPGLLIVTARRAPESLPG